MPTLSEVQQLFTQIIRNAAPLPVINNIVNNEQNAPKPKGLFLRMNILNVKDLMAKPINSIQDNGIVSVTFLQRVTFSINVFGEGSMDYLANFTKKLQLPSTTQLFNSYDIALRDQGNPRDLPLLEAGQYTFRAQSDIQLDFVDTLIDDLDYFDKVDIKREFLKFSSPTQNEET